MVLNVDNVYKLSNVYNFNFMITVFDRVVDGYAIFHWWQKYIPENGGKF